MSILEQIFIYLFGYGFVAGVIITIAFELLIIIIKKIFKKMKYRKENKKWKMK